MMKNNKNVRSNILELVKVFPHLVENYNALVSYYWVVFDNVRNVEDIIHATPAETITRELRFLVNLGMVAVPERVKKARKERERVFRSEFAALA